MSAAPVIPIRTLHQIEEDLAVLLESVDGVTPELEAQYLDDLGRALGAAKDKRDAVARYMSHLENQIVAAKDEIKRLQDRKADFEGALDKLKGYTVRVMDGLGVKKLEGNVVTLSLRKNPASIEVLDEETVPSTYKTATLTMSGALVDTVLDALEVDAQVKLTWAVDKRGIKAALDAGAEVPGAAIAPDKFALVRK